MNNKYLPFWLITFLVFVLLIIPTLVKDGMFMDGLQYACVSKNLADGLGTFWFPYLSATWAKAGSPYFLEHPPLIYGIQSLFFKLLGDGLYVERLYSLLTAITTAYLITLTWKLACRDEPALKELSWLPILFWITIPVCYWSYQNNMQENTMGVFTISSVYFAIKGLVTQRNVVVNLFISGTLLFLASFSKGIPGLFPIVVVALYWIVYRKISVRRMVAYSLILILVPVASYTLLLLNNEAYESLSFYFNERAIRRIQDDPTVESRFFIIFRLITELLPPLIIGLCLLALTRSKGICITFTKVQKKEVLLFLLIGGSASLPLLLTPVQKGFYLVASFPFYAIALALLVVRGLEELISRINIKTRSFKTFLTITIIAFMASIVFSAMQCGKPGRDHDTLNDVYLIGEKVPKGSVIQVDPSISYHWGLQFYLMRHFNISVDGASNSLEYYLVEKDNRIADIGSYTKLPLATKKYELYQIK